MQDPIIMLAGWKDSWPGTINRMHSCQCFTINCSTALINTTIDNNCNGIDLCCCMELGRLLVDKKGVGNPDQLDVVRTNDKLVNSGLNRIVGNIWYKSFRIPEVSQILASHLSRFA